MSSEKIKIDPISQIKNFILSASGLEIKKEKEESLEILQKIDGKSLLIHLKQIEDVLTRKDAEGNIFLQVNFLEEKKILLTETLIGFKPIASFGIDAQRLPKVVTTPDLVNVVEAIEESMNHDEMGEPELKIDTLHQVFNSVLNGGEFIGFDLSSEKEWVKRLISCRSKITSV